MENRHYRGSENGTRKAASKKKISNLSYRASQPASRKQASSHTKGNTQAAGKREQYTGTRDSYHNNHNSHANAGNEQELQYFGMENDQKTQSRNHNSGSYSNAEYRKASSKNHPGAKAKKKKRKKSGCGCFPILLILLLLIVGGAFGVNAMMRGAFSKIDRYALDYSQLVVTENDDNMKNYDTFALFGVDDQDNEIRDIGSRTDCIIVACIHKKTKNVKLLSIYRDTYVSINGKYDKINAAHSYGGPELALSTINRNLDLNIQDFATVNFKGLADAVNVLGGITLTVESEKELENLNDYIHNMNNINGGNSPKFDKPSSFPFTAKFDGNQAVAYSRIRYMAGGDHARASHQRLVIDGILKETKKQPWKLKKLIDVVLPQCKTSLSTSTMSRLALSLPRYKLVDSQGYPWDSADERYNGIYYGFPLTTYSNTIKAHEYLYGTKDYVPSEELGKISQKINWITEDIGLN